MRWNYSMARQPGNILTLDWYQKHGLKVMVATAGQTVATLFPYDDRSSETMSIGIPAIRSFIELGGEKKTEGMLCTAWDDRSPHFETYWRGFIASAEYSWSLNGRTPEEFDIAWMQREFATSIPDYKFFYGILREAAEFWEGALNKSGSRVDIENALLNLPGLGHWMPPNEPGEPEKTDFTDRLIELPNMKNPGSWSEKYAGRLYRAKQVIKDYQLTSRTLKDLYNNSKRNRYHWEVFSALNDFQVTAPYLLLALQQCDTTDPQGKKAGIERAYRALNGFNQSWDNLKTVYSETRFIAYPANYVPDRYFHFASQREDLSWMIQVEELFHKRILQWINN